MRSATSLPPATSRDEFTGSIRLMTSARYRDGLVASNTNGVRFRVVSNQCTGNPLYAGEQDNDPRTTTDCASSTVAGASQVVAAEFQVFSL